MNLLTFVYDLILNKTYVWIQFCWDFKYFSKSWNKFLLDTLKIFGEDIVNRSILMFALILGIAGFQLFSFGLLGKFLIMFYQEIDNRLI